MKTSLRRIATGCVAVTMVAAAPPAMATNDSAADDAPAARCSEKDVKHFFPQRVGIEVLDNPADDIMFVQESRMSRLHRRWGRYGQFRGAYYYISGPFHYSGYAYCHNGHVVYTRRYDNALARGTSSVNDPVRKRPLGPGPEIAWHGHGWPARANDEVTSVKPAGGIQVSRHGRMSEEQRTRVEAVFNEYAPKIAKMQEMLVNVLTDEQKQALASIDGWKKGKEHREAAKAAVKLTDEQKHQLVILQQAMAKLTRESSEKLLKVLADEQ